MTRSTQYGMSSAATRSHRGRVAAVLPLLALVASGAAAEPTRRARECGPIGGTVATNLGAVDANTTLGTATGDLEGAVAATIVSVAPGPNDTTVFTVQHHFVTSDGDTVFVDEAKATAVMVAPGLFAVVTYPLRITGGTGKFEGATGRIDNIGEVDMNRGFTVFRYTGRLCR